MRICVPTQTKEGGSATAYGHFGSAPYFTVYDSAKDSYDVFENAHQQHAHGACHPMGTLEGKEIDTVICAGMGARALQKLNEGGVKVYSTVTGTVEDVIKKFMTGQLEELTYENACGQHRCH
jgi:predicted Fe-Mo cluster-binding NifX family protein